MSSAVPPFRADHVGSLLRPPELLAARAEWRAGKITAEELRRREDEAIRDAVKMQEDCGLHVATDGEFRRTLWHADFLTSFSNVSVGRTGMTARFHSHEGDTEREVTAFRVGGKLARTKPIFVEDFRFLRGVARVAAKQTIPAPSLLHFRGGREAIDRTAYPRMADFFADVGAAYRAEIAGLAEAGCRYLQIDEVNFAYLCDANFRAQTRQIGEDPEALPRTYARLINDAIRDRPADMSVAMHVCRGNFESHWLAEGGYEPVAEVLFNEIDVTGYFLEYDSDRAGGFEPLRFLPKGKTAVLGLVTTKTGALESKDTIKRRIDEASRHAPLERLALSPQCGFASGERGNRLSVADEAAKLRLVVEVAREVWGD
jgi:5-methyltetrahydropteroyltriglutamate--homocysteine methyltransferase